MSEATMADVLADHHSKSYNAELGTVFCLDPTCGWDGQAHNFAIASDVYAAHQAEMLSAAGFGLVKEARAAALEDAVDEFEGGIGVSEFDQWARRDGARWNHIEEAWEHQGPYMDWLRALAVVERGGE